MKRSFPCELALVLGLIINSFSICLLVKSSFGISTLSSVPLILSMIWPSISFGSFNFLIQGSMVLILIAVTRKPRLGYAGSFLTALIFGMMIDQFTILVNGFPAAIGFRFLYLVVGLILISFGAALFMKSRLPILPFDLFVRDFSAYKRLPVRRVKTTYDLICVAVTCIFSYLKFQKIFAVGLGTIAGACFTGTLIQWFSERLSAKLEFKPKFSVTETIIRKTEL